MPEHFPFHIDGMDQKLVTEGSEIGKGRRRDGHGGEVLPAVGDDKVGFPPAAAAQIEDQVLFAYFLGQGPQAVFIDFAILKDMGGNDDMTRAMIEPGGGIIGGNPAADLQAPGEGGQGLAGRLFVAGTEHDDVAAVEPVFPVKLGVMGRRQLGGKIGPETGPVGIGQAGADDLFDLSAVQIDAGAKFH